MAPSLDRAKRKAAGLIMLQVFHIQESAVNHMLRLVIDQHYKMGTGQGLTKREREEIHKVASSLHKYANWMRDKAHELLGTE